MKVLRPNKMERCIGCHSCSLACARLVHKSLSWTNAGIRISSAGGLTTGFEARICVACNPAPCAVVCPTEALSQRKGGGVKVKHALCIQCGKCADACPVDAIHLGVDDGLPYLCIHCGRCVPFCPHGCISLEDLPDLPDETTCMIAGPDVIDHSGETPEQGADENTKRANGGEA